MDSGGSYDVIVVGGGQSALALGYYLRRTSLSYVLLDDQPAPGGAWQRTWPSLRLFSPAQWSALPGHLMPRGADEYPTRDEVIAYLAEYEHRYSIPVVRPVHVQTVEAEFRPEVRSAAGRNYHKKRAEYHVISADNRQWLARAVVMATGTWSNPYIPDILGRDDFKGEQLHSAFYEGPARFHDRRVVVVGAGNSAAQIAAELSGVAAEMIWATDRPPVFLPDDIDGRYLFQQATARYKAIQEGRMPDPPRSLGDIVSVAPVRAARDAGALDARPMFVRVTETGVAWPDATQTDVESIIWATGFRPALSPLTPLGVLTDTGRVATDGTRSVSDPSVWLLGYGDWTGFASATLIGVGRSARATAEQLTEALSRRPE